MPRLVRADCGTENTNIAFMHPYLRRGHGDCYSGQQSFRYGKSIANQESQLNVIIIHLTSDSVLLFISVLNVGEPDEEMVHTVVV